MKAHLLFSDADLGTGYRLDDRDQATVQDLGLEAIIDAAADGDQLIAEVARVTLLRPLTETHRIRYRQDATADALQQPELLHEMYELCEHSLKVQKELYGALTNYPVSVLHHCVDAMGHLVDDLLTLRRIAERGAEAFISDAFTTLCRTIKDEIDDDYLDHVGRLLHDLDFPHGIFATAALGRVLKGTALTLRRPPEPTGPWFYRRIRLPAPVLQYRLPDRDEAGANALDELRSRAVNRTANATSRAVDHIQSFFRALRTELAFYLGATNLSRHLADVGAPSCFATLSERGWSAAEVYDVALALTTGRMPVGNSLDADETDLLVVTGANQGGKTTFLRALAQNQILTQAGMPAGARTLTLTPATVVLTHFEREEDTELEHGRLDDELRRMDDLVSRLTPGALVLLNEPLTSTNEREGSEIARQVLRALREHHVRVVLVTHMYDLAHTLALEKCDGSRFLRAERNDDGTRTFRIVAAPPLTTSFGRDLYNRILDVDAAAAPAREGPVVTAPEHNVDR